MRNQATVVSGSGSVQGGAGSVQFQPRFIVRPWYGSWWNYRWPSPWNVGPYCPPGTVRSPFFNTCVPAYSPWNFGYALPYRFGFPIAASTGVLT